MPKSRITGTASAAAKATEKTTSRVRINPRDTTREAPQPKSRVRINGRSE